MLYLILTLKKMGGEESARMSFNDLPFWVWQGWECQTSCNCILGCLEQVEDINFGGCIRNFLKNLSFEKKISSKLRQKLWKIHFLKKKFIKNCVFYVKFKFGMFSAFIWYTFCPKRTFFKNCSIKFNHG